MEEYYEHQWIKSRLKAVQKKRDCGPTHGACKCFIKKIIELEAEVSQLRALEETRRGVEKPGISQAS